MSDSNFVMQVQGSLLVRLQVTGSNILLWDRNSAGTYLFKANTGNT